ncbi:hypothetical protein [Gloeobacter kilaueensis]|uniref:Uncharacterized protein n=1 Tax=Gloeobacter kilaueensis (strain ATCC BAA-2537 / CCAP 1431/1 / ULC 316 / JS1) TaxID=1183438 RepID=U5QJ88_GLOK1|nr:hypothetical protein [Gloeobacter kilaueensis]AGY59047.1 hypothetical protein GKIL_2801 [Gloeobacter kilaueensis JS1]
MPELLGRAMLGGRSSQVVYLASHRGWPVSVGATAQILPCAGIAIARTDSWALALWLIDAINAILDNKEYASRRPPGKIERSGHFEVVEGNLFAWGWPWSWSSSGIQIARTVSGELCERLNSLCAADSEQTHQL